jgi:organic radical activating enzyme
MRVADFYNRFQRTLMISLTARCNIECAHCAVWSGPERAERLSREQLVPELAELLEGGWIDAMAVSGGEPFLELDTLREIAALARRRAAPLAVHTNGFWAKTHGRARELLQGLPGITQLQVSTDEYHQEHLPLERVRNAIKAAVDCGLQAELLVCTWQGDQDPFRHQVRSVMGEDLLARVRVLPSVIDPVGRAASLSERCIEPLRAELPAGRCLQVNRPTLAEDGHLCACCNLSVANRSAPNPLRLGNLSTGSLTDILDRSEQDWLLHALRVGGPRYLAELARTRGVDGVSAKRYRRGAICDLCADLWADPTTSEAVQKALGDADVQAEIASLRALLYRETGMLEAALAESGVEQTVAAVE